MRPDPQPGGAIGALFKVGIVFKAIDGALEIAGGVLLLFITRERTDRLVRLLTENELHGSAHDFLAIHAAAAVRHLSSDTKIFAAIYLLGHGAIKLALVTGLLLKKRPVYPLAIGAFVLFLAYQLYRYTETGSPGLLLLSALDAFVIVMTALEYRRLPRHA